MKEIYDLNRAREVLSGNVPDPFGSIAHHDLLFRTAPTALPSSQIDALPKLFRRFNRADVGGRIEVADGVAFLVPSRLFQRACGPRNFMKNGQSGRMGRRRGEVGNAVEKLRPFVCLIRSMRALSE